MSWLESRDVLEVEARRIDKSISLRPKSGRFWLFLGNVLEFFRLMSTKDFMEKYATTCGSIQVYPTSWTEAQVRGTMQHESRHTQQFRWFGLGISPWLGLPLNALIYLLLPCPILFAYGRYKLELDAETARWRYWLARGASADFLYSMATSWSMLISSSSYGWAIPQSWASWGARRAVDKLIKNTLGVLK